VMVDDCSLSSVRSIVVVMNAECDRASQIRAKMPSENLVQVLKCFSEHPKDVLRLILRF